MQRKYLQIIIGLNILLGIAVLTGAQANSTALSTSIVAMPTPANSPQKVGCMMPTPSATVTPALSSISNQNVKQNSRVKSRPVSSVIAGLKQSDWDCDGISDYDDNCDIVPNPKQKDRNKNGVGDACEPKKRRKRISGRR